ncbi:MAG TPA: FtsX-like permease family protein [Alphaproteobacteria bacterium]
MRTALILVRRELRGGVRGFRLFLACLALGVGAIAGVGSLGRAIEGGLEAESRAMLGGDVAIRTVHVALTAPERAAIARAGAVSEAATLRTMARTESAEARSLVELKAVDDAYPLYGRLALDPDLAPAAAFARRGGAWGAVADATLFSRLGAKVGDRIRVGDATFELRGRIVREPDLAGGGGGFPLGPRLMVATASLADTGLVRPGSLIYYHYRLRLPAGADAEASAAVLQAAFPDATWRVRTVEDSSPEVRRWVDRTVQFLTLVGLTTLLVGGVGVGNAVRGYLSGKIATIATLKCLGASTGLVFRTYFLLILVMAAAAIAAGAAFGAAVPFLAVALAGPALPIPIEAGIEPRPLAIAAAFGLVAAVAFSLWPIARACAVRPAALFRDVVAPESARPGWRTAIAVGAASALLAALAIADAHDRRLATWFVVGAAATLVVFSIAAAALRHAASRARPRNGAALRLALANLCRPGAPTGSVVVSLGLGLTVLIAVALVEGNLSHLARESVPERAPGYFFIDIQPDQVAPFEAAVKGASPGLALDRMPMLRGRITKVNGVPAGELRSRGGGTWVLGSDRGLSWSARPPTGSRIVAGSWWAPDYAGPPLLSFDARAAAGLGIGVGDSLTVNVLGREVTARIANLREIDWRGLNLNFVLVFAPGALDGAPAAHVAAINGPAAAEDAAERAVAASLPNVTSIRVRDVLESVAEAIGRIADAVRATSAATILAGILVLAGAVAAGHRRRVQDAVILKAVGATRSDIARAFALEHAAIGLAAASIAAVIGTVAAHLVVVEVMRLEWVFLPIPVLVTVLAAGFGAIAIGFAGTIRALGEPAAPLLRNA